MGYKNIEIGIGAKVNNRRTLEAKGMALVKCKECIVN
jgi:hypothetical protein